MINQNLLRSLTLALTILSLTSGVAFARYRPTLTVTSEMSLKGTPIPPGTYKLSWEEHGSHVTVTFTKGSKVVATAEGRLVDRDLKYNRNAVVCKTDPDGTRVLVEIRLGNEKKVILFDQ